jgi:hypothetical protein
MQYICRLCQSDAVPIFATDDLGTSAIIGIRPRIALHQSGVFRTERARCAEVPTEANVQACF